MRKHGICKETGYDRRNWARNVRIATAHCMYVCMYDGIEDLVT
jgi:hypothetical protein